MAKSRFVNKTVYTKEYQKKVAIMNTFAKDKIFLPSLFMMINMFIGSVSLRQDSNSLTGWLMMFSGFIIFPLLFFVIPYFVTIKGYKTMTKDLKDNTFYVEAEFTSTVLRLKNSIGNTYNVLYEDITSFQVNKDTIVIKDKNSNNTTYLDINSFINSNFDEVKEFLDSKVTIS